MITVFSIAFGINLSIGKYTNFLLNENFEDLHFIGYSRIDGNPLFHLETDKVLRRKIKLEKLEGITNRKLFFSNNLICDLVSYFYDKYCIDVDVKLITRYV